MRYAIAALLVAAGVVLILAGSQGSAAQLFASLFGRSPAPGAGGGAAPSTSPLQLNPTIPGMPQSNVTAGPSGPAYAPAPTLVTTGTLAG